MARMSCAEASPIKAGRQVMAANRGHETASLGGALSGPSGQSTPQRGGFNLPPKMTYYRGAAAFAAVDQSRGAGS
jgi:hypothetical protein